MVSHENKFNEIKGSTRNLNRIRPYLRFGQTNKTGSLGLRIRNLTGITEHHKKSVMFDEQSSTS